MEDEHHRINRRIELLEETVRNYQALTTSVEKLAMSMDRMVKEQEKQGKRLETLENRDGDRWRKVVDKVILVVAAAVAGFFLSKLGL